MDRPYVLHSPLNVKRLQANTNHWLVSHVHHTRSSRNTPRCHEWEVVAVLYWEVHRVHQIMSGALSYTTNSRHHWTEVVSIFGHPQTCVYPGVCLGIAHVSGKVPLSGQGVWQIHNVSAPFAPRKEPGLFKPVAIGVAVVSDHYVSFLSLSWNGGGGCKPAVGNEPEFHRRQGKIRS